MLLISCNKERIVGSGSVQNDQRTLSNFKKIEISGNTDVFIKQGAIFKVEAKAYSNLLTYFETKVEGEVLKSGYKSGTNIQNDNSELNITMPVLNGLFVYGNSEVTATGNFTNVKNFDIRITGKSTVNLQEASADNVTINLNGNGIIHAFGFDSNNAVLNVTGNGIIELTVVEKLKVKITGNGIVYYKGNPVITSDITGTGRIEKR